MSSAIARVLISCLGLGACGGVAAPTPGDTEAPSTSTSTSTTPAPPLSGIVCGVEHASEIAALTCGHVQRQCEVLSGCCAASGYSSSQATCEVNVRAQCEAETRAFLEAGSCFDTERFDASCSEMLVDLQASCLQPAVLTAAYREQFANCPSAWTTGNLPEGTACVMYSDQCAEADASTVSFCLPEFSGPPGGHCVSFTRRSEGESCSSTDSCQGGTCNSSGVCAPRAAAGGSCQVGLDCESLLCVGGACVDYPGRPCGEEGCGYGECGEDGRCRERPLMNSESCNFEPVPVPGVPQ